MSVRMYFSYQVIAFPDDGGGANNILGSSETSTVAVTAYEKIMNKYGWYTKLVTGTPSWLDEMQSCLPPQLDP